MTAADIAASCEGSLRRLQTDVIDLYQIHWPERHVPAFGTLYYDPTKETTQTPIHEQLETLAKLVKAGKVRYIGLSNESNWGVSEFVHQAERTGLPRIVTIQNLYNLTARVFETSLLTKRVDAVLVLSFKPSPEELARLDQLGRPVTIVGADVPGWATVRIDDEAAACRPQSDATAVAQASSRQNPRTRAFRN